MSIKLDVPLTVKLPLFYTGLRSSWRLRLHLALLDMQQYGCHIEATQSPRRSPSAAAKKQWRHPAQWIRRVLMHGILWRHRIKRSDTRQQRQVCHRMKLQQHRHEIVNVARDKSLNKELTNRMRYV